MGKSLLALKWDCLWHWMTKVLWSENKHATGSVRALKSVSLTVTALNMLNMNGQLSRHHKSFFLQLWFVSRGYPLLFALGLQSYCFCHRKWFFFFLSLKKLFWKQIFFNKKWMKLYSQKLFQKRKEKSFQIYQSQAPNALQTQFYIFLWSKCIASICMCFLPLLRVELSQPP